MPIPWSARLLAGSAVAFIAASSWYAIKLFMARCDGFSCTYLGVAWLAWVAVLCLPAIGLGYFAQKSSHFALGSRFLLRAAWLAHCVMSISLLVWWLLVGR